MPKPRLIIGLMVLFYLIRLFLISWLELAPDESYYWHWAKHLDWSYYDHPPMIAYIMALFAGLIGLALFSPIIIWSRQHDWVSFFMRENLISGLIFPVLSAIHFYGGLRS